tara:strand:- start:3913 stop:5376 length:1464 start_codon:yes stop_codon:yes gene_type:complete
MPKYPNGKHIKTFLCNCKFQNELNNNRIDSIYKVMVNRVKHLTNKQKDKEYLMMMEQFNKNFYESCDKCSYREYSNNLIALSRPLQNDFKNIKFKKYRKSPKRDDNIITNFLYNICYDGIKQIHYPIYLINSLIKIFNRTTFHEYINDFDCITDDNKIAKTNIYAINPIGTELIANDKPMEYHNIKTYSFQYPNDRPKLITDYRVDKIIYYKTKYLYSAFYHNDNCYLYRIRVDKIYLFNNDNVLPFKDVFCLLFYEDKLIRELFKNNNLLLELKIQVVNVGKDGNKYVKKFDYNKVKKEQHKHLLLPEIINKSLKEVYIVNEDGINLFDKSLLTDTELNELFNPKSLTVTHSANDATHSVKDIIEYSSDDNSDEELSVETATQSVNNDEPQYVFSYNKFIEFTNYDTYIIERSIYNKLKDNDKMRVLFKPYNTINIVKNINKTYSKQNYFNVILFNDNTKTLSNQYHIYLDNDNNIKSITEINNLI